LIAGTLFVATFACFGLLSKASVNYVNRANTKAQALCLSRSEMERLRSIPFDHLLTEATPGAIIPVAADLYLVKVGDLYTLRSKYR
jgi:hypothetical protein